MSSSSSEEEQLLQSTPPEILNEAKIANDSLIPEKSKEKYLESSPYVKITARKGRRVYECQTCHKLSPTLTMFLRHMSSHTREGDPPTFTCDQCGASFPEKYLLKGHLWQVHGIELRQGTWTQYEIVEDDGQRKFSCNTCKKLFTKRCLFSQHYKNVHLKRRRDEFRCRLCPAKFTNRTRAKHMQDAHNITPPTCTVCDKTFHFQFELVKHQRVVHLNEKLFLCDICAKSFSTAMHVRKHRLSHFNDRPFGCQYCEKTFKYRNNWKRHVSLLHPKQFICPICNETCVLEAEVKEHIFKDHPELCD